MKIHSCEGDIGMRLHHNKDKNIKLSCEGKSYLSLEMNSDCVVNRERFSIQALLRCKIMLTIIKKGSGQDCPN